MAEPDFDVLLTGTVFLDIIFTGLPRPPEPGTEVWAEGLGSCPGGIANLAVALRRLELKTALAAAFGEDAYGDFCWDVLADQEGVDLSYCRRFYGWHSPVTVIYGDGARPQHGHARPQVARCARTTSSTRRRRPRRASCTSRRRTSSGCARRRTTARSSSPTSAGTAPGRGRRSCCAGSTDMTCSCPNHVEAQGYTRTDTPEAAARRLAEHVPVVVVTRGGGGAVAVDSATGECRGRAGAQRRATRRDRCR